jgi:hypothetical protein
MTRSAFINRATLVIAISIGIVATTCWFFRHSAARFPLDRKDQASLITAAQPQIDSSGTRAIPSGPLKVEFESPAPRIAAETPAPATAPVQAIVRRGSKTLTPQFYSGQSERITVALNETIPIRLSWPDDTVHPDVFVQAVHGGTIDSSGNNKRFLLTDSKTIAFTFTPNMGPGIYEIVLRRGTVEEDLRFWVPTGDPIN